MVAESHDAWRQTRQAELSGPDSWLGLIGLIWLEQARCRVGSGEDCAVRLPSGPAWLGDLIQDGDVLYWQAAGGERRVLATDRDGNPDTVDCENLRFFVVDRNGRLAVRLRDRDWAKRRAFAGVDCYPEDTAWQIEAIWVQLESAQDIEVPDMSGELKQVRVTHQAVFEYAGERYALLPISVSDKEVFFVFRDRTSGKDTYGAGRFLKAAPAVDGKIQLDFNRAYNPPCAFTPFATCPLPPPENWLPFAVTAGERRYDY